MGPPNKKQRPNKKKGPGDKTMDKGRSIRRPKKQKHTWKEARESKAKKKTVDKSLTPTSSTNSDTQSRPLKEPEVPLSLRERMMKRLEAARFRQINEELDQGKGMSDPVKAFEGNPELFRQYHEAYKERVQHWPENPLDLIIRWVKKKLKGKVIADFGCGEARLAASVLNTVHSFDLFAINERVTACDIRQVPLGDSTVDAVVFCLSLMGADVSNFIAEANRVLKPGGILKIAEVSSRFSATSESTFMKRMKKFGFVLKQSKKGNVQEDLKDVFVMLEFKKIKPILKGKLARIPAIKLQPSVYKKR